jgi:superfamily II DNA/RNA helicase
VVLTGKDSAKEKGAKIQKFRPDKGEPEADIIVCSDAGATGANLQSGHWLAQYDTPDTAMTHRQRQGRIDRIGQHNDIDLVDLVSDHPDERRARKRLLNKYELRNLMTSELDGLDDSGLAYHLAQTGFGASKSAQGSLL